MPARRAIAALRSRSRARRPRPEIGSKRYAATAAARPAVTRVRKRMGTPRRWSVLHLPTGRGAAQTGWWPTACAGGFGFLRRQRLRGPGPCGASADAAGHERRLDSPTVGRAKELSLLEHALERAVAERTSHLFTLMGPAGVGKSRLVYEFLDGAAVGATVLRGRCLSYGDGITLFPLAEVIHRAASILDTDPPDVARSKLAAVLEGSPDAERVAGLVAGLFGWAEPGATEDAFWAVRKLLEHLARERPVVVVFDDIHWAEPTFLDLIDHLADWTRDAAVLVLCIARPELLEVRPGWGGGEMNATSLLLEPLPADEASRLVDNLLGQADIPATARDRILEAAEGQPPFREGMPP